MCRANPIHVDWGSNTRVALSGLNYMLDQIGRQTASLLAPEAQKKITIDQQARDDGYRFIRDFGPKSNNKNQFMEWTSTHRVAK